MMFSSPASIFWWCRATMPSSSATSSCVSPRTRRWRFNRAPRALLILLSFCFGASDKSAFKDDVQDINTPMRTIVAKDCRGIVNASISRAEPFVVTVNHGKSDCTATSWAKSVDETLGTITTKRAHASVEPVIVRAQGQYGRDDAHSSPDGPLGTIQAGGLHYGIADPVEPIIISQQAFGTEGCDPLSGSGATQSACVHMHRPFVGSDLFYENVRAKVLARAFPDRYSVLSGVTNESMAIWSAEAEHVDVPGSAISDTQERAQLQMLFGETRAGRVASESMKRALSVPWRQSKGTRCGDKADAS